MATSATDQKVPNTQAAGLLDNIAQLLKLFGGEKRTEAASADTGPLRAILSSLQGDQTAQQTALLESIFQQAGAKIPGLQSQLVNATGTRTANNGGLAAMLQSLMQQTTLQAQQQIAAQNQRNQELQIQAASRLADSTRSATTKSGIDIKSGAGQLAAGTALLQLLASGKKLFEDKTAKSGAAAGVASSPNPSLTSAPMASAAIPQAGAPLTSSPLTTYQASPNTWEQFIPDLAAQMSYAPSVGINDWEQFVPDTPVWRPEELIWNQDNYDR